MKDSRPDREGWRKGLPVAGGLCDVSMPEGDLLSVWVTTDRRGPPNDGFVRCRVCALAEGGGSHTLSVWMLEGAGRKMWIAWWNLVNKTAGEYPVAELTEDPAGTPVIKARATAQAGVATGLGTSHLIFNPPIPITANKAIGYQLQSATGDTYATCGIWTQPA